MSGGGRTLVVGAGVVGLAVAEALARRGREVVVCERRDGIGQETSSRSSEVVHAGLYYPPDSLKARLCVEGRERLLAFCRAEGIGHRLIGKLIVATGPEETPELERLAVRASACGAPAVHEVGQGDLLRRWPRVRGVAGLWSPGTGIVDSHGLLRRLAARLQARGGVILCRHAVLAAAPRPGGGYEVDLDAAGRRERHVFDAVVNAAGLHADRVARLVRSDPAAVPSQILLQGCWFRLRGPAPADTLVYPVPARHLVGLGVHLTLDLVGGARLGPDARPADGPDDLRIEPGRRAAFAAAARRYLPELREDDLEPALAGIRPKLAVDRFADFCIEERSAAGLPGWFDLLGIESPGLTAALAIGERVASRSCGAI